MTKSECIDWLRKNKACPDAITWFTNQNETNLSRIVDSLLTYNHFDWANWVIARLLNKKQKIEYAVFSAEQVIDIFEKKYPDDKRPRNAIEAAKKCLLHDTVENRLAANAAADAATYAANAAADAAVDAADAAADADYAAAYAAAYTAADAADAATYAAYAAAYADYAAAYANYAAAYAAAYTAANAAGLKEMRAKILEYGLRLYAQT